IPHPSPMSFDPPDKKSSMIYRLTYPALRIVQKGVNFFRFLPIAALKLSRLLRRERIDLLHLNNSIIRNNEWMLGAQIAGIPTITHERGINNSYHRLSRYYARRLACVVSISDAVRDNLLDKGVIIRRAETIYNGIDPDIMKATSDPAEIRAAHQVDPDATVIGVLGNIKEWKGQETAVRAMPLILRKHPNTICMLVGDVSPSDNYYFERLQSLIKDLELDGRIVFTGYTNRVPEYLNALDIMLHTSIDPEPFGRVLIEAMSLRKPLIGAAAGAVPEIINNGVSGYTFEPGNNDDLADKVIRMLDDPAAASAMAKRGYDQLHQKFHIDINVQRTQELYADILAN
ncbi:MAG: glycosyltransferase family 4 protein, partial [Woeseia sp.]